MNSPFTQVVPNDGLIQAFPFIQELGHILRGALQQVILD